MGESEGVTYMYLIWLYIFIFEFPAFLFTRPVTGVTCTLLILNTALQSVHASRVDVCLFRGTWRLQNWETSPYFVHFCVFFTNFKVFVFIFLMLYMFNCLYAISESLVFKAHVRMENCHFNTEH